MFFCAISGEPPQDPVVSAKSGHVYERRLIQKYILTNGTEPTTGEKLEESDLITVKAGKFVSFLTCLSIKKLPHRTKYCFSSLTGVDINTVVVARSSKRVGRSDAGDVYAEAAIHFCPPTAQSCPVQPRRCY